MQVFNVPIELPLLYIDFVDCTETMSIMNIIIELIDSHTRQRLKIM